MSHTIPTFEKWLQSYVTGPATFALLAILRHHKATTNMNKKGFLKRRPDSIIYGLT